MRTLFQPYCKGCINVEKTKVNTETEVNNAIKISYTQHWLVQLKYAGIQIYSNS